MHYGTVAQIGVVAAVGNAVLCVVAIFGILFTIRKVRKECITELNRAATILPTALDSLSQTEIPVAVIAAVAKCLKISVSEIIQDYKEDSQQRRRIVLQRFRSDPLTWKLIRKFPSKFIAYGYVGEELIHKNVAT